MGLSVVIPAYNEAELIVGNLQRVHSYLENTKLEHEIIVVTNGCVDNTVALVEDLAKRENWVKLIALNERGAGRAFAAGVKACKFEQVVGIDADLPCELSFLRMAHDLLPHCSAVYGSKFMGKQERSLVRIIGSQLYILCSQLFFGFTVSDFSQDSKAFHRSDILPALDHTDPWTGYPLELAVYLSFRNKRIIQVSIEVKDTRSSRYNLIHEALFRYSHLFRCWRKSKDRSSWFWT